MNHLTYLCGGIHQCDDSESVAWREYAKLRLGADNCLDPMRRDYRGTGLQHAREIIENDLNDIDRAHFLLVNPLHVKGFGTPMEVYHAWLHGKTIVTYHTDMENMSVWLYWHSTVVFSTLDRCIDYIIECRDANN